MDTILSIAEQLDRAAVELRFDHPVHNRLAIILIDNAIELMARQALFAHISLAADFRGITAKHRKLSRSKNLTDRLSILVFAGELTHLEVDFILAAHEHRNVLYHEGTADALYLRQLAFHYYTFACDYLARFSMAFYRLSSRLEFTEIGRHYYDASSEPNTPLREIDRGKLAKLLLAALPEPCEVSLQEALADSLEDDRRRISAGLRFLIENSHPSRKADFLIATAQFNWARDSALIRQGLDNTVHDTPRRLEAIQYFKGNLDNFKPRYRSIPHGSWAQSIRRIRASQDPRYAAALFRRTRKNMTFLRDAVMHAVACLEAKLERD